MKFKEYEKEVLRTAMDTDENIWLDDVWLYGLFGEAGEFVDAYKKMQFHHHPYDKNKLLLELGDVLWYNTMCIQAQGGTLDEIVDFYYRNPSGTHDFIDYHKNQISFLEDIDLDDEIKRFIITISASVKVLDNNLESLKKSYRLFSNIFQQEELVKCLYANFYSISLLAFALESDVDTVAKMNVEKLRKRYPDGFKSEKSINRNE